ncbi:hypothetical protein [Streptomyces boluensis]|uniref:hypothetical protein n=1 Tax=Streptomyces boluensis TaxID=1775135 RepID=UPI001FE8FAD6|nr:hypothetical protein [Streptomyces boluensis]
MPGREIKGARDRGTPVDQERGARGVAGTDSDSPDVMMPTAFPVSDVIGVIGVINSPETETGFDTGQFGGATGLLVGGDIPFQLGLHTVPELRQRAARGRLPLGPQLVETDVEAVHELLLVPQFNGIPG